MKNAQIAVIDYGMGNLRSVAQALRAVAGSQKVLVTSDPADILAADRVVFPGQGAMPDCQHELAARGLTQVILEAAKTKPFLGICLGLQVLFEMSEEGQEGNTPGLGLLQGSVRKFRQEDETEKNKIPHMGWNRVQQTRAHPLFAGIPQGARFYFVHSFYVAPSDQSLVCGTTHYGKDFTSVIARDNLFALQCHPEKSAGAGLALLENFVRW